jgi:hypothetical protein
MLSKEFLVELSAIGPGVVKTLKQKGYTLLGKGVDMQAWLEPKTGLILKIFGFALNRDYSGELSRAQHSFKLFADYCQKNSNNPFLPEFFGWEQFKFDDEMYLQIRMERMFPLSGNMKTWGEVLNNISEYAEDDNSPGTKQKFLDEYFPEQEPDHPYNGTPYEEVLAHLGKDGFNTLWNTCYDLGQIARKNRFILDLHPGNFMLGSDGHIVISDPFYIP